MDYATEIFQDVIKSADALSERIISISNRTNNILTKLPEAQGKLNSKDFQMASGATSSHRADQHPLTRLLQFESMPPSMRERYEDSSLGRPAPVQEMDRLLPPDDLAQHGGSCAKKYSYPEFFFEEWCRVQAEEQSQLSELKGHKTKERRERKQRRILEKQKSNVQKTQKKGINWRDR